MVMATPSSSLTNKLLILGQPPVTTDTVTAPAFTKHTTPPWSTNDRRGPNPFDDHRYHGGEPRMCSTSR